MNKHLKITLDLCEKKNKEEQMVLKASLGLSNMTLHQEHCLHRGLKRWKEEISQEPLLSVKYMKYI